MLITSLPHGKVDLTITTVFLSNVLVENNRTFIESILWENIAVHNMIRVLLIQLQPLQCGMAAHKEFITYHALRYPEQTVGL